jgi:hypothetical protein
MNITDKELERLENCKSAKDWSEACDAIKGARGQMYPDDWWDKVKQSGMMDRILARWGGDSQIRLSNPDDSNPDDPPPQTAMEIIMAIASVAVDLELNQEDLKLAKQNRRMIQDAAFGGVTLKPEQIKALQDGIAKAKSENTDACYVDGQELDVGYAVQLLKYWNERAVDRN